MRSIISLLSLSTLLIPVQSLYFYIDGTTPKCFFEELPKDTLVVGHYTAEEYDENRKVWSAHDGLHIFISVDVCPSPPFHPHVPPSMASKLNPPRRKYSTTTTASSHKKAPHPAALPSVPPTAVTTKSASRPVQPLAPPAGSLR